MSTHVHAPHGAHTMPVKPNKFGGKCTECGQYVKALQGLLTGKPGHWGVKHRDACPEQEQITATVGVYDHNGALYVVKPSKKNPGHVYACKVVPTGDRMNELGERIGFDLEYDAGVIFHLTEAERLSFADANAFSAIHGQCIGCKAVLKAEKTIAQCKKTGIWVGPDCREQLYPHTVAA